MSGIIRLCELSPGWLLRNLDKGAEDLPFEEEFGAVVCSLGILHFPARSGLLPKPSEC